MIKDPVVIVAGASQSGTTSLYELFSQAKGIQASNVKELDFWHRPEITSITIEEVESRYLAEFPECSGNSIRFEASPAYLRHGVKVVPMIKQCLANVKIIVILRKPDERLYAVYRKMKVEDIFVHNIDFDEFIEIAKTGLWNGKVTPATTEIMARADVGNYLKYLHPYLDNFTPDQLAIINFHQLIKTPAPILQKLEAFVGLPSGTFSNAGLPWTNKNDAVNNFWLHYAAKALYMRFEPIFRRQLWLKNALRKSYQLINTKRRPITGAKRPQSINYAYQSSLDEILETVNSYTL